MIQRNDGFGESMLTKATFGFGGRALIKKSPKDASNYPGEGESVPQTEQVKWADAPGNVLLRKAATGLDRYSVADVSLLVAVDKALLTERVGRVPERKLELMLAGIDVVLGR